MIRSLKKNDVRSIRKILIDTNHFNDEEINVALELIDIYIRDKNQKDYLVYVHEPNEKNITGYICYGKRPLTEGTYDLYWIAVNPEYHGKGIGSKLVQFMEDYLSQRNANLILIETSGKDSYENERRFYEKNGYLIQTVIKDFYRANDDLYIYHKYLNIN